MKEENGHSALYMLAIVIVAAVAFLSSVHVVFVRPLETKIEALEKQIASSSEERDKRIKATNDLTLNNKDDITKMGQKFIEVETQFGAVSKLRNVQREQDYRLFGLLWRRVYGETLPNELYFPLVGTNGSNN